MDEKKERAAPNSDEFHYHYSARKESQLSQSGRQMLDVTGKVFLSGAIAMGGIFLGGFLLIGILLLGIFTVFLGGGTLFCTAAAGYLLFSGIQMLAAGAFTGLGVLGFGLIMIAVTLLFGFATMYWIRRVVPGTYKQYLRCRGLFGNKEVREDEAH